MNLKRYIDALKNKDQQAFEAVYHETKHAVYAMALGIVKDRSLAEDVMQESYMKMVENIYSYNKRYKFINWLLTITKNTALDTLRKRNRETSVDVAKSDDLFPAVRASEDKRLEAEHYLSLLSDDEQKIVLLKTVANMTHKEIAELLDRPVGSVTWKYSEALKKMQRAGRDAL